LSSVIDEIVTPEPIQAKLPAAMSPAATGAQKVIENEERPVVPGSVDRTPGRARRRNPPSAPGKAAQKFDAPRLFCKWLYSSIIIDLLHGRGDIAQSRPLGVREVGRATRYYGGGGAAGLSTEGDGTGWLW
jgi:hypothetical protein